MHYSEDVPISHGRNEFHDTCFDVNLGDARSLGGGGDSTSGRDTAAGSGISKDCSEKSSQSGSSIHETPSPESTSHQLQPPTVQSSRQRTSQACDKCRERKTKVSCVFLFDGLLHAFSRKSMQCSGNRPVCVRCASRGLICEYSLRENRVRTPARARSNNTRPSPDNRQLGYLGMGRPTPAHHSRIGGSRTNAFTTGPLPTPYSGRIANTSSTPSIPIPAPPRASPQYPPSQYLPKNQQVGVRRSASARNLPGGNSSTTSNSSFGSSGDSWSYDTNFPLHFGYDDHSLDAALRRPPYPSLDDHEERLATHSNPMCGSLPESSTHQFDYEISKFVFCVRYR